MSDVIMKDHTETHAERIENLEKQILDLRSTISNNNIATCNMITEMKKILESTRNNTNEHLTDIYGAMDHLIIHQGHFHDYPRQRVPVKHYV